MSRQQQRQVFHDPPEGRVSTTAHTLPLMRRDDAPALKRYEPSVLVPSDAVSVHASQLPQRPSPSYTGTAYHHGSSGMMSNPYSSRTKKALPKALPRMKKSDENSSATSIIGSFHRGGEESEPSFIRATDKSIIRGHDIYDSPSLLRLHPAEDNTNDGKSILKPYASDDIVETITNEDSKQKPNNEFVGNLLPSAESSNLRSSKMDPSITESTNGSFASNTTMMRPDRNFLPVYVPLDPSVTDGTNASIASSATMMRPDTNYHPVYVPLDPSVNDGTIASIASSGTMMRADTNHHPIYVPGDPSITSLTILEDEPYSGSIVTESSLVYSFDNPTRKRDPSVATNSSVTSDLTIVPPSITEPIVSTAELSTTTNELDPSVVQVTSTASDSTLAGQLSNVSYLEPTPRHFPKDPSVLTYIEDYYENNDSVLHPSQDSKSETNDQGAEDTFATDSAPSANSFASAQNNSLSVNLVRKNSACGNAFNLSSNGHASNYFERSLIEEINLLIEEEQRESSVLSIPMVPAVLDDATTLLSTAPSTNTAANVGQNQEPEPSFHNNGSSNIPPGGLNNQNTARQQPDAPPAPSFRRHFQPPLPRPMPMKQLSKLRQEYGLPVGFVMEVARYQKCAYTYLVCDTNDIEENSLQDCAQLAATAQSEIVFCLSNNTSSQELLYPPPTDPLIPEIQRQRHYSAALNQYIAIIRSATWSATPTIRTIQKLFELAQRIPRLELWQREKVSVVIVTNRTFGYTGEPELTNFIQAINALHQIDVRVTIRLSTLDVNLVDYYNRIKQAFPSIALLSTFEKQKALVQKYNPWLNYGEQLHRLRELGYQFHNVIEMLSQRKLNKDELRVFFVEFYGRKAMLYSPDLYTEWEAFYHFVETINNREGKHQLGLNPKNRQQRDHWIITRKLDIEYGIKKKSSLPWRSLRSSARSSVPLTKRDMDSLRIEL